MKHEWLDPAEIDSTDPAEEVLYLIHRKSYEEAVVHCVGRRVLEVGCGAAYGTRRLRDAGARIVGLDPDREALRYASASAQEPPPALVAANPVRGLPFGEGTFDTVVLFQVIEHIEPAELPPFLDELARVLRPGGTLLVTTPNRAIRLLPLQRPWNRWHAREYDARSLAGVLARHFETVEVMGLRGSAEVERIERARSARNRTLLRAYVQDPLAWLRRVSHLGAVARALGLRRSPDGGPPEAAPEEGVPEGPAASGPSRFTLDDLRLDGDDLAGALTLWARCRKGG